MENRTAVPERPGGHGGGPERPAASALRPYHDGGLDLTPEELVTRRRNRRWVLAITVFSVVLLTSALVATSVFWSNEPSGPRIAVPSGYKAVSDGYFAYAVPDSWNTNPAFSDDAGDLDTSGPSGWAGENRSYRFTAPALGDRPPTSLQAFGMARPAAFDLIGGRPLAVGGATAAFAYTATRPGGFRATVIDAWTARTGVEMWLMIQADPAVTARIVSSLRA